MSDVTPPIRNFQRLVTTGHRGAILTTGGETTPYPEWSEGECASGGIVAFNGVTFAATTVVEAAAAAGDSILSGGSDSTVGSAAVLTVEGLISALPSGQIHVPYPDDPDDAASMQYVDDAVQAILSASGGITQSFADGRYINASGDTMSGDLTQPAAPTASGHLTNRSYVDTGVASAIASAASFTNTGLAAKLDLTASAQFVEISGDVMTGHITQPNTPTASGHLVNKSYADSLVSGGDVFVAASASFTLTDVNTVVFVDSSAGPVDVSLPSSHTPGRRFTVKDFGATGSGYTTVNLVRIVPTGGALFEGASGAHSLTQDKESATMIGNGTNWGRV